MDKISVNQDYLEKVIVKSMMDDPQFALLIGNNVEQRYFEDNEAGEIFSVVKKYYWDYNSIPNKDTIVNSVSDPDVEKYLEKIDELEPVQEDFLYDETEKWLKQTSFKYALMDSVDLVKKGGDINQGRDLVENALIKTLKEDIGILYWDSMGERLKRIFNQIDKRIPSFYPQLDEFLNGGFPPFTLSVISAAIHGQKSNTMCNIARRQMMNGYNVVYLSFEMAGDEVAKRIDAGVTGLDINKIYDEVKTDFLKEISIHKKQSKGELFIKQFPTGGASVNDIRAYLKSLEMRGYNIDIIYVDYLNIMQPTITDGDGNLYSRVKRISEELRALTYHYAPIVTATQINRAGLMCSLSEVDFMHLSESLGTGATADFLCVLGIDEDALVYKNEVYYKIIKNRLGGRVGEIDKLYFDDRSLRLYDSTQLEEWIQDASKSQGSRELS